jgi:uncharacterized protein YdeI (YjbR/CyaY-like superfamily)/ribosomal protein S18 acetylase RimI-like enzyme
VNIRKITGDKKEYINLLLLADEQESMIDKYLGRGEMFVLNDSGVKAECVITKETDGTYELKNIAVMPDHQRKGYGKKLIEFLFSYYSDCKEMLVGTGDSPATLTFYQRCGFTESHRIKNFFTDNYDHPMFEEGKQLVDMIYLKRERYIPDNTATRNAENQMTGGTIMAEIITFSARQEFRAWLEKNYAENGIWLLFGKRGGPKTLSANEALEEALCFGWIDGQMESLDEYSYKKYFARRTKSSKWSDRNKKIAQDLTERGLISAHGMQAIEHAKQNGQWEKSNRVVISEKDVTDFDEILQEYDVACQNFRSMSPSIQKNYTGFYLDAKTEKTRQARLARIVERLNQNLKPM